MSLLKNAGTRQLIYKDEDTLKINYETLKMISSIKSYLAICVIVGPYRQGKSFLLNKLLGDSEQEFQVGHNDEPCTEGVYVYEHPAKLMDSNGNILTLLMMDVEVNKFI